MRIRRRGLLAAGAGGVAGSVLAGSSAYGGGRGGSAAGHEVRHRMVRTNGIRMHVAEAGEPGRPAVVMLHGFPELWWSWRHLLPALAGAGFHAIAPDLRGYGRTDAPANVDGYTLRAQLADLRGLLEAVGARTAALVAHDQGAGIAWAAAELEPERYPALVALGVPYSPRTPVPLTDYIRQNYSGKFNVVLYFQEPGVAEAELDADAARTLRMTMYALSGQAPEGLVERWLVGTPEGSGYLDPLPDPGPPSRWCDWLTDRDFAFYAREFARTGFAGAIRRYRALDADWHELPEVGTLTVEQPVLFVAGELDSAYRFGSLDPMYAAVPGLRDVVLLPGCGHWTQQERAEEVSERVAGFLRAEYVGGRVR